MEIFSKAKAVRFCSHLDKYLIADDDQETVRQSRNIAGKRAIWFVESIQHKNDVVRLRSCHGKYLTASDVPLLLGMTGQKVTQTFTEKIPGDSKIEWEVIADGFQWKFKSCSSGKYLRANGGTPPWRNSVTHDQPYSGSTKNWVIWDVEQVQVPEAADFSEYLSSVSSFSSVPDDVLEALSDEVAGSKWDPQSPVSVMKSSPRFSMISRKSSSAKKGVRFDRIRTGMELFHNAKAVRLRSHHDKYLLAEDDEVSVSQDRNGSSKSARWTVERVPCSDSIIRLKSCFGKYLTASNQPFLLGVTGRKVLQTLPGRLDSSLEWEPVRDGTQVKLRTRYGNFLRANGGLPPWRNSVTHDIPHRTATQDWVLWDIDVLEIEVNSDAAPHTSIPHADSLDFDSTSPSAISAKSGAFSRQESNDSYVGSPPKSEGRTIYYHVAEKSGEVDIDAVEGNSLSFKGNGVDELTQRLKEETGLADIVVCTTSPLNGKLYPLRLQLPPNNADMHVVVLPLSPKVEREFTNERAVV